MYASNTKGRCTPVILQAETSLAAGVSQAKLNFTPELALVLRDYFVFVDALNF